MNNIDSPLQVDRVYENFSILFYKYQQNKHKHTEYTKYTEIVPKSRLRRS